MIDAGSLISVWFSVGGVVPLIMSFSKITETWFICLQVLVFVVVTALSLIFLRKFAKKALYKNTDGKTNLQSYVGKKVKIASKRDEIAYIKINGIEFSVFEENEKILNKDDYVEILKIEGNKFIVKLVTKED